ncbi:TP901 family phage tail tape measure protein [Pseudarthrobacter sp. W1I19]|uniref:phage tail tape measure protein n=1 Tax=Pseudarthrobacter sp. W1I19 TaxID=3042288 RepID=UPI002783BB85|nr:phage tail tape measure protein [Pseudarthrobacter sp. W1I19]MDQ0922479.1 TP901 family phage tail tape measure protein [Pseudarthrobacter sp. W1I19]
MEVMVIMAERRVSVKFSAEIHNFKAAMAEASAATQKVKKVSEEASAGADTHLGRLVQSAHKNREAWDTAGTSMLGFGTAAVGGLELAGKAAMDWESAWAGVTKTVDGTPKQMDELESSLRGLAKTLPATHEEIAGVAEAAGQLGVKRQDVVGFTETMIALGETTNLSADEAATAIAQISNVMGTMQREGSGGVERFGATLVALGNAGASTEAEIVSMAKRIAGAGKLVGASESDVLALANAMASVGIEAELGGGVISRVMQRMYGDVKTGGEGLDNLAKVAGVSSKDFAAAFETDPVRAVDMMVQGLNKVKESGGNVIDTMANLGIKGTEETGVILRLAGAGGLLADSLKLGDEAWASNSALAEEAAKRYETTEAKVQIAWNNIKDAAIEAGAVLLPIISGVAEGAAGVAQAFGSLPAPVQGALSVLGGVAGVAALGAGAFLTLTPRILDSMNAFKTLAPEGSKAAGALGKVGKAAGLASGAFIGFEAIKGLHNSMQPATASVEEFTQALVGLDKSKSSLDSIFSEVGAKEFEGSISTVGESLDKLINQDFNSALESFGASLGINNGMAKLADGISKADQALASAASSGNMDLAAKGFKSIADSAENQGISLETVGERFPEYLDSLRKMASDSNVALTDQELLNWALGETPAKMEAAAAGGDKAAAAIKGTGEAAEVAAEQAEAIEKALDEVGLAADGSVSDIERWTQVLFNAGLLSLSASDAQIQYQAAIDAVTESVKKNGTTLDINTEQGRANQSAYNGLAQSAMAAMTATAAETLATQGSAAAQAELQKNLWTSYNDLIRAAGQLGITGDAADAMARKALGIPNEVPIDTWVNDKASSELDKIKGKADNLDGRQVFMDVWATTHETTLKKTIEDPGGMGSGVGGRENGSLRGGLATGGRVPGYADGGQLPTSGPGTAVTDGFLGIDPMGMPKVRVDAGEWIVNRGSSDRYNRELAAINAGTFPKLPGYANGGREYRAQSFAAPAFNVGAPEVRVFIGNEQIDARIEVVAGGVTDAKLGSVTRTANGRAR